MYSLFLIHKCRQVLCDRQIIKKFRAFAFWEWIFALSFKGSRLRNWTAEVRSVQVCSERPLFAHVHTALSVGLPEMLTRSLLAFCEDSASKEPGSASLAIGTIVIAI